jgi:uncharacterized protein YdaL
MMSDAMTEYRCNNVGRPCNSLKSVRPSLLASAIFLCSVGQFALSASTTPAAPPPRPADVLIIHDSLPGPIPSGVVDGNNILDLLGHFGMKGELVRFEDYKAGEIARHRFVIVLGVDDRTVAAPTHLLADVRSASIPVLWFDKHLNELLADEPFAAKLGMRQKRAAPLPGFESVSYKDKSLPLPTEEPGLFPVEILDSSKVQVIATATKKDGTSIPYIVRSGSFWYTADSPFAFNAEGDRYLVFCDILHDFLKIPHPEERKALVRIEDVTLEEDPDNLLQVADFLGDRHIPFQFALVPIFKDPANHEEIYLSDRPKFVAALKYMISKGGIAVLHGTTHQYRGKTGDDYEFWDELGDKPIQGDSRPMVEQRIRAGLDECFKNGIYPVSWETPHYMASELDYQAFARYFNSAYERVASVDRAEAGHFFPYTSVDRFGRFIIPEALGYISQEKPEPDLLVENADHLLVVRDGVASFFYHPFMGLAYLEKIVDGIEGLGYRFISIREYDCRVQIEDKLVQTYTDSIQLRLQGKYLHRLLVHDNGRVSAESYSEKPLDTVVKDPGMVPEGAVLVMEGVSEILAFREPPPPSTWETFREWLSKKFERKIPGGTVLVQPKAVVLWDDAPSKADWNNQNSYVSALSSFGIRASARNWKDFSRGGLDSESILIVPRGVGAKLSSAQATSIDSFVREGGRLVLEGPNPLSELLGIQSEKRSLKVRTVDDLQYGNKTTQYDAKESTWNPVPEVPRFTVRNKIMVYAQDQVSELPMAVLLRAGRGRVLYLAARLDPITPLGYTRYPYFVHYVIEGFSLKLPVQRGQVELYYDPGGSPGGGADIDRRAENWRRLGIRAVYVAAIHFWPTYTYNYEHFVDVCHKNGILAYAWFELPHVSQKFWDDHPEWRAKTATGKDGLIDWRHHMDLDIPECRDAVYAFVEDLLRKYPWDGVNIAELNYDTNGGPERPDEYLPMGAPTRAAFKALGGFDPILLFKPDSPYYWKVNPQALRKFEDYRSQRVIYWHRALLERITPLAQERDMEIIVTMLDSLHSKNVRRDTGMNSHAILGLMDQFPFTLQVEDPGQFWADSPDRYKRFTDKYLSLVRDRRRLMFDINIVPERNLEKSHSPTQTMVGTELAIAVANASLASGRAAIYSEGTLPFSDISYLSRIMAANARVERRWNSWVTESDRSILLNAPGQWQSFRVDDQLWPGWGESEVFIPGGSHSITAAERKFSFVDTSVLDFRLLRFTGNLNTLKPTDRGVEFSYDSLMRTLALFNRQPHEIRVDGNLYAEPAVHYASHWSVRLPRGQHKVEVIADSTANVILDATSLYSSSLIVIFGTVACALMALLYMAILIRRAYSRAFHAKSR